MSFLVIIVENLLIFNGYFILGNFGYMKSSDKILGGGLGGIEPVIRYFSDILFSPEFRRM